MSKRPENDAAPAALASPMPRFPIDDSSSLSTAEDAEIDVTWRHSHTVFAKVGPRRWDETGWLNQMLRVRVLSPDLAGRGAADGWIGALPDRMMESDEHIPIHTSRTDLTLLRRRRPFARGAQGTQRTLVAHAHTEASTNPLVAKAFTGPEPERKPLADLVAAMRRQALAKAFALEFNTLPLLGPEAYALDVVVALCAEVVQGDDGQGHGGECLLLEPLRRSYEDGCCVLL